MASYIISKPSAKMLETVVQPLLTDLYQFTMAYGYWKAKKQDETAVFELYFRKNPFQGEFTIFCGLRDVISFLEDFKISEEDIAYLRKAIPSAENGFFDYLRSLDTKKIKLYAQNEGSVVFPRVPLICIEGPLGMCQLLETTLLTLVNFSSLVATNAVRYRLAAGQNKTLLEFGLRRAQGPDGGLTASKYCYVGGFDATSNVLAGKMYNIPVRGTQAHAFVNTFATFEDLKYQNKMLQKADGSGEVDLVMVTREFIVQLKEKIKNFHSHEGELASFVSYALSFPAKFLVLIDTYDTLSTGVMNFLAVALALNKAGYKAGGIRLDSGDLAYQSVEVHKLFSRVAKDFNVPFFETDLQIVASNDINEETLHSLRDQDHRITSFGVGTNLVTCQSQPALGCVYKIVQLEGKPCIKISQETSKITFPGKKNVFRLYGKDGNAILDLIQKDVEPAPKVGQRILCQAPDIERKRAHVEPSRVESLLTQVWGDSGNGHEQYARPTLHEVKSEVLKSLDSIRDDVKRRLNPTPYKVSVTKPYYNFMHEMLLENDPIGELA